MKIELIIDQQLEETKITVSTPELTPEIQDLLKKLENKPEYLIGVLDEKLVILDIGDIITVYSENQKVFAKTMSGSVYQLKIRLYEAEEALVLPHFVRISNSEIVNFKMVKSLDLSFNGTICINLKNGDTSFVSRRYMPKIKSYLGL